LAEMKATRQAYGEALAELGRRRPEVVVLDADLSSSTGSALFARAFPERFFNMGVAEQNMMAVAAGLAQVGKIPFASTFAIFAAGRAWEVVRQSIAYSAANVKIGASHGGVTVGADGGSHQAVEDLALMRTLPNMVVLVPADAEEMRQAVNTTVEVHGPCYLRSGRIKYPVIYESSYNFRVGMGHCLREGSDVTVAACGLMVHHALAAAEALTGRGISAEVLNISTIKPLDEELVVASAAKTGCVVTCEEHLVAGGLGGAVCEALAERRPVPVERIGLRDTFGISGSPEELLEYFGLTPEKIAEAAQRAVARKRRG